MLISWYILILYRNKTIVDNRITKILDFSRLFTALWIQVGIWQYWPKFQPWGSQGWLFLLTQTMLVIRFCQKYYFDKKEKWWGYVFCIVLFFNSFVIMVNIFLCTLNPNKSYSTFKNSKNLLKVYDFFLCTEYIKVFQQKKHVYTQKCWKKFESVM